MKNHDISFLAISAGIGLAVLMTVANTVIGALPSSVFNSVDVKAISPTSIPVVITPHGTGIIKYIFNIEGDGKACRRLFTFYNHSEAPYEEDLIAFAKKQCKPLLNAKGTHVTVGVSTLVQGITKTDVHHFVLDGNGKFHEGMK